MITNFLVYQAYGSIDILNEVLVSISSAYKFFTKKEVQIVVYTDSVDYLEKFLPEGIHYEETPLSTWEQWKGERQFVHRAKIQMLRDFSSKVQGNILYCDTDTYFLKSPLDLFGIISEGSLVMHTDEGKLKNSSNLVFRKLEKFLSKYKQYTIPSSTHMWNAGVLGFRAADRDLLDQVLKLSDDLYAAYQKHVMEQLAFSYCFQSRNRMGCEDQIFHYWDFKEYRKTLAVFFVQQEGSSFAIWSEKIENLVPMKLQQEKKTYKSEPNRFLKMIKWFTH